MQSIKEVSFSVYLINFGYVHSSYTSLVEAMDKAEDIGFECNIIDNMNRENVATYSPIGGWRHY